MFKTRLASFYNDILLTNSEGEVFTGGDILKHTELLYRGLSCIGVSSVDNVCIYSANEFHVVCSILACMSIGANFTLLDHEDNLEDTIVKIVLTGATHAMLISEDVLDHGTLTLDPSTYKVIAKGWNYYASTEEDKDEVDKIFKVVKHLKEEFNHLNEDNITIPMAYKDDTTLMRGNSFHPNIKNGLYTYAIFSHYAIYRGMEDSSWELGKEMNQTVLMLEPLSTLYNVVNGVIGPILNGVHVITKKGEIIEELVHSIRNSKAKVLYIYATKFEKLLELIQKEVPNWIMYIPILRGFVFRYKFRKILNVNFDRIILHGKIRNRKLLNLLWTDYTVLYVMNEVASFIAKGNFMRLPKKLWLTPRLNVQLETSGGHDNYGEINVISDDLFLEYSEARRENPLLSQALPKTVEGKLRTEDIGLVRNGKVLVKDRAHNIFVNDKGLVIESGKILQIAKRFKIVNEATIAVKDNKLILLVEPNFNYIEQHNRYTSPNKVFEELTSLKELINRKVSTFSAIDSIIITTDPDGLPRKNFRILSRHF